MKTAMIFALLTLSAAAQAAPTKCYYNTKELGVVCSSVVPSWNDSGKAFDQLEAYFKARGVRATILEGGCSEITATNQLRVSCAIDLASQQ